MITEKWFTETWLRQWKKTETVLLYLMFLFLGCGGANLRTSKWNEMSANILRIEFCITSNVLHHFKCSASLQMFCITSNVLHHFKSSASLQICPDERTILVWTKWGSLAKDRAHYGFICHHQGLLYHRTCKNDLLCSWPSLNSYLE